MALYNNPYQYSFGVPGQMNQFQQQPVQIPAQPVQQPQQNNSGILWVSGEVGAKSYLVAPGTSVLLMDSDDTVFYLKTADQSGMPSLRTFKYSEITDQKSFNKTDQNNFVNREEFENFKNNILEMINKNQLLVNKDEQE
nr:MAG: hypothetical protein [Bacteriophage sp.]